MILPDVNILVFAHNEDFPGYRIAKHWWGQALDGEIGDVGLAWVTILGFIRVLTNRSVLEQPLRSEDAVGLVQSWLQQDAVHIATPGEQHAEILFRLLKELGAAGNLTTDAHLAALALEYRGQVATCDTDFARFKGLRWFNPLTERTRR